MNNKHQELSNESRNGLIAWFAGNHVAANLLMIFVIATGILSLFTIKVEIFPQVSANIVRVLVPYLGATPSEVEEGVCLRVEEAITGIDGVKRVQSIASEGSGTIIAEVEDYADVQKVLEDIKSEVDRIETFPEETEKPITTSIDNRTQVIFMAVYGDIAEKSLKNLANDIRDDLTALKDISLVEIQAQRRYEISIEVSEETLRRYNLSFDELSRTIANSSLDLPGGSLKTEGGEILVRTKGQKYLGKDFENIVILSRPDGTILHLRDIATVIDGFEDSDIMARYQGKPAVMLYVFGIGEQNALKISDDVHNYIEEIKSRLPAGSQVEIWFDFTELLRGRMDLLKRNGIIGIILVFLCLTLFLDLKLALWTTIGIPISFCGAFFLMPMFGVSLNMISLFAFIVSLGIVVDDAIVIGENIFDYRQQGMSPMQAAIVGAKEMASPVTMAILTTIAAFSPLLFLSGMMGKFIRVIPLVVILVLSFSLLEAFLILPAHLSASHLRKKEGPIAKIQHWFRNGLDWFINNPFGWLVERSIAWRYATFALSITTMLIIAGFIAGGQIQTSFFEPMEADNFYATLTMPQGTSRAKTEEVVQYMESAAQQVQQELFDSGEISEPIYENTITYIGLQPFSAEGGGPHGRGISTGSGAHLAEVNVQLIDSENRDIKAARLCKRWQEIIGEISGASSLTYTYQLMKTGDPVNVELSHRDFDVLVQIAEDLKKQLQNYNGVTQIADSFEPGKVEFKLNLNEKGRTLGLTLGDLARQVRQGFYGQEVQRIQRGRDDIRVMLRYPQTQRKSINNIRDMRLRLVDGTELPFTEVADIDEGRGYATINRADRRRIVAVTADVDESIASAGDINEDLKNILLPQLKNSYPGLTYSFQGEQKERTETFGSLKTDFVIALIAIYGLLAIQFRSYAQPLIIMSAIPFGLVGAVIGHVVMGYNLSFLSMFGIVALTGVVVNDSLILVDLINRRRHENTPTTEIVLSSTRRRFRPIILTTLTTFFGLMPMILEKSIQAKFLIPMALSLGFGVLFATGITLVLVPALYMILEDIKTLFANKSRRENESQLVLPK